MCILVVAACCNCLLAQDDEAPAQESLATNFLRHLEASELDKLMAMFHPKLKEEVDPPVLQALIDGMKEKLGKIESIEIDAESKESVGDNEHYSAELSAKHANGSSTLKLKAINGQVISFSLNSEELKEWFKGPPTTDFYEEKGNQFIQKFTAGKEEEIRAMCHPALQKVIEGEKLTNMIKFVDDSLGQERKSELSDTSYSAEGNKQKLTVQYNLTGDKGDLTLELVYQFVGMKGHLLEFSWK